MMTNFQDGLYFVPLGGSEQFGVNLNVYIAEGKMLAIDCGIGFADERLPGIDLLLPDPIFIEDNIDALEGMLITHAHEDHIGAVAYLYSRFKCPLYATPFTANILRRKLEDQDIRDAVVHEIDPAGSFKVGPFELHCLPVAHSIPDACSVLIKAAGVKALHSGDWNLDPSPVVGAKTEGKLFQSVCKGGVDVYIGDSTNSGVPGRAGSESEVETGLCEVLKSQKGRVLITTFSSNIGRLVSIVRAANDMNRKVVVIGRSMHRMISAAMECGLIDKDIDFIAEDEIEKLPDDQIMVVCTGSQGESRAALPKISRGDHHAFATKPGDTVIFSARTIPGNELAINQVKNNLIASGVRVITPSDTKHRIHVSGHPCQDEILEMWSWIKPKAVIPVHGEREQLESHAALARSSQIETVVVPSNGSVIQIKPGSVEVIDHVETGVLAVDQKRIITARHRSIAARRKLQYTGVAFVSIALNAKGKMAAQPFLETEGLIDENDEDDLKIEDRLYDDMLNRLEKMSRADLKDDAQVAEEVRIQLRRRCNQLLGLRPKTVVHVLRV